jgi:hypothetical protein
MVEKYAVTEGAFSGLFHDVFGGSALAFADAVANGHGFKGEAFSIDADTSYVYVDDDGVLVSVKKRDE